MVTERNRRVWDVSSHSSGFDGSDGPPLRIPIRGYGDARTSNTWTRRAGDGNRLQASRRRRCEITHPDHLIVLDPTLIDAIDVTAGLDDGGTILINSDRAPESYTDLTPRFTVATVNASDIAVRHGLGTRSQPIVNTAIVGASASVFGWFGMEAVEAAREAAKAVRVAPAGEVSHV